MKGLNKMFLMGNLGSDPELRYTSGGTAVAEMRVATNRVYTNKEGNKEEDTQWHRVVVWGKQGENCKEYLAKGEPVFVEGRVQTRQWEDRDGNKRYTTEVVAEQVTFLSNGNGNKSVNNPPVPEDDDIPF